MDKLKDWQIALIAGALIIIFSLFVSVFQLKPSTHEESLKKLNESAEEYVENLKSKELQNSNDYINTIVEVAYDEFNLFGTKHYVVAITEHNERLKILVNAPIYESGDTIELYKIWFFNGYKEKEW